MPFRSRGAVLAAALVTPFLLTTPAHARGIVDTATVHGIGAIRPGLPCPASCTVTADLRVVFAGADGAWVAQCAFGGTTGADTLLAGSGWGDVQCDDGSYGTLAFARTLAVVQVSGDFHVGWDSYALTGTLAFVPDDALPTTAFLVEGEVLLT